LSIENATGTNNQFIPLLRGHVESAARNSLFVMASTISTNDVITTIPMMTFNSRITSNLGVGSSLSNRLLFGWQNYIDMEMVLSADGYLGLSTMEPESDLHIKQSDQTATGSGGISFENNLNSDNWKLYNSGQHFSFAENKGTGILRAYINAGNGNYIQPSDEELKKNVEQLNESILDKVLQLQPKYYQYKDSKYKERKNLGFIAQEVQELFPEIVYESDNKQLGLSYSDFGILAIKAIQEMNRKELEQDKTIKQIKIQQEIIERQEKMINRLSSELEEIKVFVNQIKGNTLEKENLEYTLQVNQQAILGQNKPNPFNQKTIIEYSIPNHVHNAIIQFSSVDGRVLGTKKIYEKGKGQITLNTDTYNSGIYYYSLIIDGKVIETKQMKISAR